MAKNNLAEQMKRSIENRSDKVKEKKEYDGNLEHITSTGSTLLDLCITGEHVHGGGLPSGILVEIFGPSGSGKTVLLSEIAGAIQRKGGEIMFHDPEARLNKQFAQMFDLDTDKITYGTPDTVTEVFSSLQEWEIDPKKVNGIMTDSLAALSTNLEMDNKEGDKMGMRRAKEFSEGLRKTARILKDKNLLMVCSNQVRVNADAGPYGQKHSTPGGVSIGFYSSVRLRTFNPKKINKEIRVAGKVVKQTVGIETEVEVFKNSCGSPYKKCPVILYFDYGIDDIRTNLQYIKDHTKNTVYTINDEKLSNSMDEAISMIEEQDREQELREQVINLWEEINNKFASNRKKKQR